MYFPLPGQLSDGAAVWFYSAGVVFVCYFAVWRLNELIRIANWLAREWICRWSATSPPSLGSFELTHGQTDWHKRKHMEKEEGGGNFIFMASSNVGQSKTENSSPTSILFILFYCSIAEFVAHWHAEDKTFAAGRKRRRRFFLISGLPDNSIEIVTPYNTKHNWGKGFCLKAFFVFSPRNIKLFSSFIWKYFKTEGK